METNKICVTVRTRAKKKEVKKIDLAHFEVAVAEAPEKGLANRAALKALAKYLDIPVSSLSIISGASLRNKVIKIK
jgi:uncharacterized protein